MFVINHLTEWTKRIIVAFAVTAVAALPSQLPSGLEVKRQLRPSPGVSTDMLLPAKAPAAICAYKDSHNPPPFASGFQPGLRVPNCPGGKALGLENKRWQRGYRNPYRACESETQGGELSRPLPIPCKPARRLRCHRQPHDDARLSAIGDAAMIFTP